MSREEPPERTTSSREAELSIISQGTQALAQLSERIAPRFKRAEVRKRVGRYLRGLLASVERKNGWQMAEELAESNVHGVQRLLAEADWDEEVVHDDLRSYVIEHLGEAGGMLVIDETGFLKKGKKSAGVARQYSGTAGRRENSQVGVFLVYSSPKGAAFIDRALYLPKEWTSDRVRCREAGIPDEVEFAANVPAEWVIGDTVYGYDVLRIWLDEQKKNYVLAVPETHTIWVQGRQQPVGLLAALLPAESWVVLSAGEGSKGPRLYAWAWLQLPTETDGPQERARFLVILRSLADPDKRAYYRVAGPAQTTLPEVVRVAGSRWKIEEGHEQAKGEVGLDQYEVRTWRAWYRYMTLASLAYAALVVMQGQARTLEKKGEKPGSGLHGVCRKYVASGMRWASPSNSRSAGCTGLAFVASIRRERSASIGCVALARHPRYQQTRRLPCAYWEFLRSRTGTGSSYARSCRHRSHRRAVQLSIIA